MTQFGENVLFDSSLIQVLDYRCRGTSAENGDDEWSVDNVIVLPRAGTFVRYDREGLHVANANHVLFFHQDRNYAIRHPVSGGDTSTVFVPERPVLMDMLRTFRSTRRGQS